MSRGLSRTRAARMNLERTQHRHRRGGRAHESIQSTRRRRVLDLTKLWVAMAPLGHQIRPTRGLTRYRLVRLDLQPPGNVTTATPIPADHGRETRRQPKFSWCAREIGSSLLRSVTLLCPRWGRAYLVNGDPVGTVSGSDKLRPRLQPNRGPTGVDSRRPHTAAVQPGSPAVELQRLTHYYPAASHLCCGPRSQITRAVAPMP